MKKLIYFIAAVLPVVLFLNCSKKKDSTPNPVAPAADSMKYSVNGIADVNIRQYFDTSVPVGISVIYSTGPQETLTLTPTSPAGVTVSPASMVGIPGFATTLTFRVYATTTASIPVTILAQSKSSSKTFTFNFIPAANSDCASGLAGTYNVVDSVYYVTDSTDSIAIYRYTRGISNDTANKLFLPPPGGSFPSRVGHLNCGSQTFVTDTNLLYKISAGTGTFSRNKITATYTQWESNGTGGYVPHLVKSTLTRP